MRQGYEPNKPQKAAMANAAMALLSDASAKLEVRAEAARALGQMPITSAVSKYNFQLVGHSAGQLAVELGNRISGEFKTNQDKARYLTALLIGPVYQAFDGVPGARDSGLLHTAGGPSTTYVKKVFDLVKPIAQSAVELLNAGQRQIKKPQKELMASVAALKDFLDKNPPPTAIWCPREWNSRSPCCRTSDLVPPPPQSPVRRPAANRATTLLSPCGP